MRGGIQFGARHHLAQGGRRRRGVEHDGGRESGVEYRMLVELDATSRQQARRILRSMVTSLGG